MADKTPNNQAILSLAVQGKNIYVMSEDDPNNRDPIAKRKLAALYGEGNILVLPRNEFLKYLGGEDIISILSSEGRDPVSNYVEYGEDYLPEIVSTLPPPVDAKIIGDPKVDKDGNVTVKIQFYGPTVINGKTISYLSTLIAPAQKPTSLIAKVTASAFYPLVSVTFDTVADASKYLVKLITTTDPTEKTFSGKVHIPTVGAARTTYTFSAVPRGTYKVSVIPYNAGGISGSEVYVRNTDGTKKVLTV